MRNHSLEILKKIAYKTISWEPILSYFRKTKLHGKIVVLVYHELADDSDDIEAWTVVKRSDFTRQMDYLLQHFDVISLKDAIYQMNKHDSNRIHKPAIVITFDDGYAGNKQILLPIVKSMNIPVTIFVATRAVQERTPYWYNRLINRLQGSEAIIINLSYLSLGNYQINHCKGAENTQEISRLLSDLKTLKPNIREDVVESILKDLKDNSKNNTYNLLPLSINEVRELAECLLITIGAHSHCHNILTQLKDDEISKSVKTSKQLLEDWIGCTVQYFAYPNGNYNGNVINIIKETGFECGLTTGGGLWGKDESIYTIPRIGIGRYDSFDYFKVKISGALNF